MRHARGVISYYQLTSLRRCEEVWWSMGLCQAGDRPDLLYILLTAYIKVKVYFTLYLEYKPKSHCSSSIIFIFFLQTLFYLSIK